MRPMDDGGGIVAPVLVPFFVCLFRVSRTTGTYGDDVSDPFLIATPYSSPFFVGEMVLKLCGGS